MSEYNTDAGKGVLHLARHTMSNTHVVYLVGFVSEAS
jgi:hypothetical protein